MNVTCSYCGKEYSTRGIKFHIWRVHSENGKKFDPNKKVKSGETAQWNKGKKFEETYDADKIKSLKESCARGGKVSVKHTQETKLKLSKIAKDNNFGGYTKGGGRGKHGWYKGYWCDSSWELAFVIYNIEHNIQFTRNTEKFTYTFENKKNNYIPDFIIDEEYFEIKGWSDKRTIEKIRQFPLKLTVLYEKDLKHIFEYVTEKYGNNWIELYESACGRV